MYGNVLYCEGWEDSVSNNNGERRGECNDHLFVGNLFLFVGRLGNKIKISFTMMVWIHFTKF